MTISFQSFNEGGCSFGNRGQIDLKEKIVERAHPALNKVRQQDRCRLDRAQLSPAQEAAPP
jgi:hypothetical protein